MHYPPASPLGQFLRRGRVEGYGRILLRFLRNWCLGRRIESRGNLIELEGLTISLDHPEITKRMKSALALGNYERHERELIGQFMPRDLPVIELGGAIGVVSCLINRLIDHPEHHVVVEANPTIIPLLTRNRDTNRCRFTIEVAALAYDAEEVIYYTGSTVLAGGLHPTGGRRFRVPAVTLGRLLEQHGFDAVSLIMDIEGSEGSLVEREPDVLRSRVRWLILELHPYVLGSDGLARMLDALHSLGFVERGQEEDVVALENTGSR
jgi:FkbM family methyltransferase